MNLLQIANSICPQADGIVVSTTSGVEVSKYSLSAAGHAAPADFENKVIMFTKCITHYCEESSMLYGFFEPLLELTKESLNQKVADLFVELDETNDFFRQEEISSKIASLNRVIKHLAT